MSKANLILTQNWEEINQADKLGLAIPQAVKIKTKILFYNRDVKRTFVDGDGNIILIMNDGAELEVEYSEKLWKTLDAYFRKKED